MHVSGGLIVADMETLKTNRRLHRRDAEDAEERAFDKHYSELCGLCVEKSNVLNSAQSTEEVFTTEAQRIKLLDEIIGILTASFGTMRRK